MGDIDKGPETSAVKTSAHTSVRAKADDSIDTVFVMTGTQIDNGIDDRKIRFRGSYRCQSKASVERLNLICSIHASSPVATTGAASSACAREGAAPAGCVRPARVRGREGARGCARVGRRGGSQPREKSHQPRNASAVTSNSSLSQLYKS